MLSISRSLIVLLRTTRTTECHQWSTGEDVKKRRPWRHFVAAHTFSMLLRWRNSSAHFVFTSAMVMRNALAASARQPRLRCWIGRGRGQRNIRSSTRCLLGLKKHEQVSTMSEVSLSAAVRTESRPEITGAGMRRNSELQLPRVPEIGKPGTEVGASVGMEEIGSQAVAVTRAA
jgi:hypothetical protein